MARAQSQLTQGTPPGQVSVFLSLRFLVCEIEVMLPACHEALGTKVRTASSWAGAARSPREGGVWVS